MCTGACVWLLEWLRVIVHGARLDAPARTGPARCLVCQRSWCSSREGQDPCALRRALEEANLHEYMRWIAATFPREPVPGAPSVTFAGTVASFTERFPRDSHEYGETLNYFMLQAGQRYMRLGVTEFVEVLAIAVQAIEHIAGHTDGEMHEYIQWIRRNRGHRPLDPAGTLVAATVLEHFTERVPRDSPVYRSVFRSFLANRAVNHTEQRMDEFVREIRWVLPPQPTTCRHGLVPPTPVPEISAHSLQSTHLESCV